MKKSYIYNAGKRIILCSGLLCLFCFTAAALYMNYKMNHDITSVLSGRLYRSSKINPTRLSKLVTKHGISLVIDLRHPDFDDKDDPQGTTQREILESRQALRAAGVDHISIPSLQIPNDSMVNAFLNTIKGKDDQAILIHCDHGIGRAGVYTAIYLIEYEGFSNKDARRAVSRYYSLRIHGRKHFRAKHNKGKFIMEYVATSKSSDK